MIATDYDIDISTLRLLMLTVPSPSPLTRVGSVLGKGQNWTPPTLAEVVFTVTSGWVVVGKAPGG